MIDRRLPTIADGEWWCARCERVHAYCECDDFAHLGTHSSHNRHDQPRPHPMDE